MAPRKAQLEAPPGAPQTHNTTSQSHSPAQATSSRSSGAEAASAQVANNQARSAQTTEPCAQNLAAQPTASPTTALAGNSLRAVNPLDLAPSDFREALSRRSDNRKVLIEWIRESLVDGVDFGAVPLRRGGFSKPSLRKPGAEKICGMLGVTASFPTLKDYETAALEGRDIQQIILRCHLLTPDGQIVADGVGARSMEQDYGDMNKALKMAIKSAMIDATLRMAGLSEIFTQDLEDMPQSSFEPEGHSGYGAQRQSQSSGRGATYSAASQPANGGASGDADASTEKSGAGNDWSGRGERRATERQVKLIRVRLDQAGIPESDFLEKFGLTDIAALPFAKVNPALHWISGMAA